MVASPSGTVESRGPGYGQMVSSLLPDLYLLDPSQFQQPVQYLVPSSIFPFQRDVHISRYPLNPVTPPWPLIEENTLSLVTMAFQDPIIGRGNVKNMKTKIPIKQTTNGQHPRTSNPPENYRWNKSQPKSPVRTPPNPAAGANANRAISSGAVRLSK